MQAHRIGVLTSGGDCPGLNAVLRGVTMAAEKQGWQVAQCKFGTMVSYQNSGTSDVPIADAVNRIRLVDPNHQLIATAREIGVSFGD